MNRGVATPAPVPAGLQLVRLGYFGKLPAHGDFIRACEHPTLAGLLDQWLAEVMQLLTVEPRWKLHYDALAALDFAFVGTGASHAIAGRISASRDQSLRRFPFLCMSAVGIAAPGAFAALSPLVLAPLWQRQQRLVDAVLDAPEPAAALRALASSVLEVAPSDPGHARVFAAFLQQQNLDSLEAELAEGGCAQPLRQLLVALALLLAPLRGGGGALPDKALRLPLPRAPRQRALVASFWLHLIVPLLAPRAVELALFFSGAGRAPALTISFCGAEPDTLRALIDADVTTVHVVDFDDLDWLAAAIGANPGAQHLAACLAQPQLSLGAAQTLFHQTLA